MTIHVVQRAYERDMSIPPESNLTPVNSRKRPRQVTDSRASKRRRMEDNSVMGTVEEQPENDAAQSMEGAQQLPIDRQDHRAGPDVLYMGQTHGTSEGAPLHQPAKVESPETQRIPEITEVPTDGRTTGNSIGSVVVDRDEHASPGSGIHLDEVVADHTQANNDVSITIAHDQAQELGLDAREQLPAGIITQSPEASRSSALLEGLEEAASEDASDELAPASPQYAVIARGADDADMPDVAPDAAQSKKDRLNAPSARKTRKPTRDVFDVDMSDDARDDLQHAKKPPVKKPTGKLRSAGNGPGYALKRSSLLDVDNSIDEYDDSTASPLVTATLKQKATKLQPSVLKEVAIPVKARSPERNVQKLKTISATSGTSERSQERRSTPSEQIANTANIGSTLSEETSSVAQELKGSAQAEQVPSTTHAHQPALGGRQSPPIAPAQTQLQRRLQSAEVSASSVPSAHPGSVRRTRIPLPSENKKELPTRADTPKLTKAVSNVATEQTRSVSRDKPPGKAESARSYRRVPLPSELAAKADPQKSAAKVEPTAKPAVVTNAASKASAKQGKVAQKQREQSLSNSKSLGNAMAVSSAKATVKSQQEGELGKKGASSEEQEAADTQPVSVNRDNGLQGNPKPTQGPKEQASASATANNAGTQQLEPDNTKRSAGPEPSGRLINIESDEESSDDNSDSSEDDDDDDDESDSGPDFIPHYHKDHGMPDADGTESPSAKGQPRVDKEASSAMGDVMKTVSDSLDTSTEQQAQQAVATEQSLNAIRNDGMKSLERHGSSAKTTLADKVKNKAPPEDDKASQSEVGSESASDSESEGGTESEQESGEESDGKSDWNGLREVIRQRTTKTAPAPAASPKRSRFSIQPNGELRDEKAARAQLHESQESYNSQMQAKPHKVDKQGDDDAELDEAEDDDDNSESESDSESEVEVMHGQADTSSNAQIRNHPDADHGDEEMQDQIDAEVTPQPSKLLNSVHPEDEDETESDSGSDSETGEESNDDTNDEEDDEDENEPEEDEADQENTVKSDLPSSPPSLSSPTPTSHSRTHHSPPSTPTSRPITPGVYTRPAPPQQSTAQAQTKPTADTVNTTSVRPPISGYHAAPKRKFPSLSEMKQLSSSQAQAQSQASLIPESSLGASSHPNGTTNGTNGKRPTLVSAGYDDTESERSDSDSEDEPEKDSQGKTKNPYASLTGILYKGMGLGR